MSYSHKTNHSFEPSTDFWRAIENLFTNFPFHLDGDKYKSKDYLIKFYENRTKDAFDVTDNDSTIYSDRIKEEYYMDRNIKEIPSIRRMVLPPNQIITKVNYPGKLIAFLEKHIKNSNTVHKFQEFLESMYDFLLDVRNLNPKNTIVRKYGVTDENDPNYETKKQHLFNDGGGLLTPEEFKNYFNTSCRRHKVPFVMFTQNVNCYVVHITDIFIEKAILEIPIFLKNNNLEQANDYFVKAVNLRDEGNYKESLNNLRQAMEDIRDEIYKKYELGETSTSLHNDLKRIFENYRDRVFDFSKIPQTDSEELEKIISKLKESTLLIVKATNIGAHSSLVPELIEENTTLFAIGLVASIFPYLFYLLK